MSCGGSGGAVALLEGAVCRVGVESCAGVAFGCPGTRKTLSSCRLENAARTSVIAALLPQRLALPGIGSLPAAFAARRRCPPCKTQLFLDFFEENSI